MKKRDEEGGSQEWLNTYADMITLVLTFFVLLYSISNINMSKLEEVAAAMQKRLGIETTVPMEDIPADLEYPAISENTDPAGDPTAVGGGMASASSRQMVELAREIQTYFETENLDAVISSSDNAVYIRFKNDLLFDPDSAVLRENSRDMLDALGVMLNARQDDIMAIYINGHTAQAANSLINDRILSSSRADNVAIYLEENCGIEPRKLICRGYGKYYPIAENSTKEGREQNRRVDMIILGSGFQAAEGDLDSVETMDPLAPVQMPGDMAPGQKGTAQQ